MHAVHKQDSERLKAWNSGVNPIWWNSVGMKGLPYLSRTVWGKGHDTHFHPDTLLISALPFWAPASSSVTRPSLCAHHRIIVQIKWNSCIYHEYGECGTYWAKASSFTSSSFLVKCNSLFGVSACRQRAHFLVCASMWYVLQASPHMRSLCFSSTACGKVQLILEPRIGKLIAVAHLSHIPPPCLYHY